jgi:hypothetical protein
VIRIRPRERPCHEEIANPYRDKPEYETYSRHGFWELERLVVVTGF